MSKTRHWFKCDECGKFIPYKDLDEGYATVELIYPDSEYTRETFATTCKKCNGYD